MSNIVQMLLLPVLATPLQLCPVTLSNKLKNSIISGDITVIDTRSNLTREVDGYVKGSLFASEFHENPPRHNLQDAIFLLDDKEVVEEICSSEVKCYCGSLEALGNKLVYPKDVSFQAVHDMLEENRVILVDVRSRYELATDGRIPGSYNVPLTEIPAAFQMEKRDFKRKYEFELPDKDAKNVILSCRSGVRALEARKRLMKIGYNHLRLFRGSFNGWVAGGGEVV